MITNLGEVTGRKASQAAGMGLRQVKAFMEQCEVKLREGKGSIPPGTQSFFHCSLVI